MLVLAVLAIVGWSGYSTWENYREHSERKAREMLAPAPGAECRVVCHKPDGKEFKGRFVRLNSQWVVIETQPGVEFWVPRENVAFLTVTP